MARVFATGAMALVAVFLVWTFRTDIEAWLRPGSADRFAGCRSAQVSGAGDIGGPFTLVNAEGRTVSDADVITEPTLIYFGYTSCPDVCPVDAARNAAAVDILEEMGISATPVFITVDPARDTPEVVGEFAASMHPKMIGLTGSAEQVQAASQAYRTFSDLHDSDGQDYLVDHQSFTYLVLPGQGFVEYFRSEVSADEMATATACFVEAAGSV